MEFLIAVIGGLWIFFKCARESAIRSASDARIKRINDEHKSYEMNTLDENKLIDRLTYHENECIDECRKYIEPFSPSLSVTYGELKYILMAKYGYFDTFFVGIDKRICKWYDDYDRRIKFWHQVENALHDAGRTDAIFYIRPGSYCESKVKFTASGEPILDDVYCEVVFGQMNRDKYCKRMW